MKKIFLLLVLIGIFSSCQKKSPDAPVTRQEVTFGIQTIDPGVLKSSNDTWNCSSTIPDMAWIEIDGEDYYSQLTTVNGQLYTQSIQLTTGTHTVNHFVLYKENDGKKGPTAADPIVYGTPEIGSEFAVYVKRPVGFPIEVNAFAKTEVSVQVLCFSADQYTKFGYNWFDVQEVVVREQFFFGDFCTKHFNDYAGSHYALQLTGLALDMPAIFKIMAYVQNGDSWDLLPNGNGGDGSFTNDTQEANYGVGAPVTVIYPDNLGQTDNFKFELYILVKQGEAFNFVLFHTWTFSDDEKIPAGNDGVVDFELGNCNVGSADLQLPPYLNLPAQVTLKMNNTIPSTTLTQEGLPGYFDIILSNVGSGFDIADGKYAANCFRIKGGINNAQHPYKVESSLYPDLMGPLYKDLPWDKANWLMNHLANYPGHTWSDVQQALWMLEDPNYNGDSTCEKKPAPITDIGLKMVADANLLGPGFVPAPGDLVAVVFERLMGGNGGEGGDGEVEEGGGHGEEDSGHMSGDEEGGESGGNCNKGQNGKNGNEGEGESGQKGQVKYIFLRIDP
ncbi:MAG: hypothetical protein IH595_07420 [Bacteroidales bacterium]|nr:hypothetical protein [Bacteroidales bacterium]